MSDWTPKAVMDVIKTHFELAENDLFDVRRVNGRLVLLRVDEDGNPLNTFRITVEKIS